MLCLEHTLCLEQQSCDLGRDAPTSDTALVGDHEHIVLLWVCFSPCWIEEVVLHVFNSKMFWSTDKTCYRSSMLVGLRR